MSHIPKILSRKISEIVTEINVWFFFLHYMNRTAYLHDSHDLYVNKKRLKNPTTTRKLYLIVVLRNYHNLKQSMM